MQFHISYSETRNKTCSYYIDTYFLALREDNIAILETIPLLNKETITVFYKIVCDVVISSMKNAELNISDYESLALHFSALIKNVQAFEHKKSIITHALKFGRKFVDTFATHLISSLGKMFKVESSRVLSLIKELQVGTKILQVIFIF